MISYYSYYLILSFAIGIFQIIEGLKLFRHNGKLDPSDLGLSVIEFIWFIVSCGFIIYLPKEIILLMLPLLYITYNLLGWAYSYFWGPKITNETDLNNVVLPMWVCVSGTIFGAVFAGVSAYLYFKLMVEYVI